ncbi:hypothetical protein Fot_29174 [Forsythia ovata]|uniref:Uncharacterized protein n=1 Tax=Forsythia ovata TaxID=205694 RepID=A0ABD1TR42_9LAMI
MTFTYRANVNMQLMDPIGFINASTIRNPAEYFLQSSAQNLMEQALVITGKGRERKKKDTRQPMLSTQSDSTRYLTSFLPKLTATFAGEIETLARIMPVSKKRRFHVCRHFLHQHTAEIPKTMAPLPFTSSGGVTTFHAAATASITAIAAIKAR